jgi:hypothetical protein
VSVIGELDQRRQSLETEIGLLSARKRQLEEDTSLLSADLATLSQGLFSLRQEHNTARASLETKQQTLERAERDLTEAAAATAQEHERFSKAREAAENLHRDFQRKESEAHRQLQDLEAQIETARRSNAASARSAGKKIQDDTAKAQTDLSKAKDDTAHAQAELEKILADTRSARADFRQAQGEVKTAAAERDHLADGLKRARQSVAQAEAAARDAQAKASAEQDKLALVQRDVSQAQAQAIAADGRAAIARRTAETEEVRAQQANKQADEEERRVLSAQDALRRALEGSKSSTTTAPVIPASSGMSGLAQLISPARASTENDLSSSPSSLPPAAAATGGTGPNKRNSGASTKFQKVSPLFGWDDDLDAQADLAPTTPATVVPARPYQPLESLDAPTPAVIAEPRSESQTSTQATAVNNAAHAAMSDVTTTKLGTSESAKEPDPSGASSSVIPRHGEHHVSNPRALSASSPQFGRGMAPVSIGRNASHFGREPPPLPSLADAWRERELRQHAPVTSPPARKESQGAGTAAFNMMKSVLGFRSSSTPENAASQSQLAPETLAWAQQPWSQDTSPLQQRDQNGSPVGFYVPGALDAPQFKHDPWKAPPKDAKLVDVDSETGYDIQDDGEQAAEVTVRRRAPYWAVLPSRLTDRRRSLPRLPPCLPSRRSRRRTPRRPRARPTSRTRPRRRPLRMCRSPPWSSRSSQTLRSPPRRSARRSRSLPSFPRKTQPRSRPARTRRRRSSPARMRRRRRRS